jgi:hypothetical protein
VLDRVIGRSGHRVIGPSGVSDQAVAAHAAVTEPITRLKRSLPSLQVHGKIALGLLLRASVSDGRHPAPGRAVVFELSVGYGQMIEVIDVMQDNALACVRGHRKADGIGAAVRRHTRAAMSVAQVAEVAQSGVIRSDFSFFPAGTASPAEARAQRQPAWERPSHGETLFFREKVRTCHNGFILVAARGIV